MPETLIGKEVFPPFGIRGEVLEEKRPVLYPHYENHPERLKELDLHHFKEFVGVPLTVRQMVIGVMVVGTTDPDRHFLQSEIDLLSHFAQHAAIAIGNAQLYEDSL